MRKTEEDQGAKLVRAMTDVLLGGGLALVVCLVFLLICSVGISGGWVEEDLMYQLSVVGCVIGGFSGGIFAVRHSGARALIVGLASGGVFFLLILTAGVLLFEDMSIEAGGLGLLSGALCGGGAVGILGTRPKKKKRRK